MYTAALIFGNQLFRNHPALGSKENHVFMIEAFSICSTYKYHKHKLILVLAAMREYRDELVRQGYQVDYIKLNKNSNFFEKLNQLVQKFKISNIRLVLPEDRTARILLDNFIKSHKINIQTFSSPGFLTPQCDSEKWFLNTNNSHMENFYRWQRKRQNILITKGKPTGGKWNYDEDNRKPLPKKGIVLPKLPVYAQTKNVKEVSDLIDEYFPQNPGSSKNIWLPVTHKDVHNWLAVFIKERLSKFGTYEDAMAQNQAFLFHSVLSPFLNIGLLTPSEVVTAVVKAYQDGIAPLNSIEGFIRQIIGWREYMRAIYWVNPDLVDANYFGFNRELEDWWYTQEYINQDLPLVVKSVLKITHRYGYNHHIERLMVLGNWFLINEYNPRSVFTWFQSMYVDAYEWVMLPNVQGMSQYADGGYVATKPYISGGNYLQKMGHWWENFDQARKSQFTQLYWKFLKKHRNKLKDNPRMKLVLKLA